MTAMHPLPVPADETETARPRLREVVREIVEKATSQKEATETLLRRVRRDEALRAEMLAPFEARAAAEAVAQVIKADRRTTWQRPSAPDQRIVALGRAASSMLMEFRLPSGRKLAEATAAELIDAAGFYARQAGDMAHKARWLRAVRDAMGEAETVAAALDEATLRNLQSETAHAE